jgi:hypothetical protein
VRILALSRAGWTHSDAAMKFRRSKIWSHMDEVEMVKECERICGESGKHGIHHAAPEMCPIQLAMWKNPKRKEELQNLLTRRDK